jgi:hypothetical protein
MRRGVREQLRLEYRTLRGKLYGTERRESLVAVLILAPTVAAVAWLAVTVDWLAFVLFPPLGAVTYNLFAHPEQPVNFPWQVPVTLTVGAGSGAIAQRFARWLGVAVSGPFQVGPVTAGVTVLLAGGFLYLFDTEIAPALAVGLLLPFAGVAPETYVLNVFLGASIVAVAFAVWRRLVHDDAGTEYGLGNGVDDVGDTGEFVFQE